MGLVIKWNIKWLNMWLLHSIAILAHLVAFIKQLCRALRGVWKCLGMEETWGLSACGNLLWARKHWLAPGPIGTPEVAADLEGFGLFPSQLSNHVQEPLSGSRDYWHTWNCHGTEILGFLTTQQDMGIFSQFQGLLACNLPFHFFVSSDRHAQQM